MTDVWAYYRHIYEEWERRAGRERREKRGEKK